MDPWFSLVHRSPRGIIRVEGPFEGYWTSFHSRTQSLREEVTQLTRSLRRAETETKVLQETLAGQLNPDCQPMATNWIQEKVWLSQEVRGDSELAEELDSWREP